MRPLKNKQQYVRKTERVTGYEETNSLFVLKLFHPSSSSTGLQMYYMLREVSWPECQNSVTDSNDTECV